MSKFIMKSKASQEAVKKAKEKGGGKATLKLDKAETRLLILGPVEETKPVLYVTKTHEIWADNKPRSIVGTPAVDNEKDKIIDLGWKLREKYLESDNEKKRDFFKRFLPKEKHYVNVLEIGNEAAGPQVFAMPAKVRDLVLDELGDCGEDLSTVCDFDEGRILLIKSNMKPKFQRKYACKFLAKTANLIENGILDETSIGEVGDKLFDLEKLQPAFDEEAFDKHFEMLKKSAEKLNIDLSSLDEDEPESDSSDDEFEADEPGFDGDDENLEEDLNLDGDDLNFDDEPAKEEKKKETGTRTRSRRR